MGTNRRRDSVSAALHIPVTIGKATPFQVEEKWHWPVVFYPVTVTANIPCAGFVTLRRIRVRDIDILTSGFDAYELTPDKVPVPLDIPSVRQKDVIRVEGEYSGLIPKQCEEGSEYVLTFLFKELWVGT